MNFRLMSNNQWRCDKNLPYWEERGLDCSAEHREKGFADFYARTMPDVIGLQEVSPLMLERLMIELQQRGLPFAAVWGRDTPTLYRTDKFELIDSAFLIYPRTIPGLEGEFNNSDTKSYSIAVFRTKEEGKIFTFMSTPLWWKSDDPQGGHYQAGSGQARGWQMALAIDKLDEFAAQYKCPQIIVGDLNTAYESEPIRTAFSRGFSHAHDIATDHRDETNGMHPCGPEILGPYEPKPFKFGIDHILVRNAPEGFVINFRREMPESYLPLSDHAPIWADVVL